MQEYLDQLARIKEAFKSDFERFKYLRDDPSSILGLSAQATEEILKELDNLEIKYTGRKSEFTALQKTIGKYSSADRPGIGKANAELKAEFGKVFGIKSEIHFRQIEEDRKSVV